MDKKKNQLFGVSFSFFFVFREEEKTQKIERKLKVENYWFSGKNIFGNEISKRSRGFEYWSSPTKPGNKTEPSSETLPSFNYTGDISDI